MTEPRIDIPYSSPPPPGSNKALMIVLAVVGAVVMLGACVVFAGLLFVRTSRPAALPPAPTPVAPRIVPATRVTPP